MKRKKLTALLSALAMLITTAPVFAVDEDTPPPIAPETIVVDELDVPIAADELEEPDVPVEADGAAVELYAADGAEAAAADGTDNTVVAQIGETPYTSLNAAITAASDGDTIKLIENITTDAYANVTRQLTLDLNGCTLTSSYQSTAIYINGGDLTIVDDSGTGKVVSTAKYAVWVYKGNLTLESGTLETQAKNYVVNCAAGASMTINGGTITGEHGVATKGSLTMNNGTITGSGYGIDTYGGSNSEITINNGIVKVATNDPKKYLCAIYSIGTLAINGGTVETIAQSTSPQGIRSIYNAGTLTMKDGTVRCISNSDLDPSLSYPKSAHGIFNNTGASIEISGGTVECTSKTPATVAPDGIFSQGKLIIKDGTITVPDGIAITGNGDQHGTECIITGGTITGGLLGIYHPQDGKMTISGGTITGGQTGIEIRAGELTVTGGTITGNANYFEKDKNGTGSTTIGAGIAVVQHTTERTISLTVTDGQINGFVPLYEGNVQNNPQAAIDKVKISLEGGVYKSTNTNADSQAVLTEDVDHYMTGGIYSSKIPYKYIHPDYYRRHLHENMYEGIYDDYFEVTKPDFTVVEIARTVDAEVDLVDLIQNDGIDGEPFSIYKVIMKKSSDEHAAAMDEAIANNTADHNTKKTIFDILVKKTDDAGKETYITDDILDQKVMVTLTNVSDLKDQNVHVYYRDKNHEDIVKEIKDVEVTGNEVTFTAPILSTYAITYDPAEVTEDNISKEIGVVFSPVVKGGNQYYITLKPLEPNKRLHRYMSADIAFKKICSDGRVIYEIEPAEYMNATLLSENKDSREYHFEMDGINVPDASCVYGEGITIGTITFSGYGRVDLRVDTDYAKTAVIDHTVNIANTATMKDNVVEHYTVEDETLVVNETVDNYGSPALKEDETGTIQATFSPDKANLTVNIAFNNTVKDNEQKYQDMTVTISGGDLAKDKVIKLGNDADDTEATVEFDEETSAYKIVCNDLTRNVAYNIKVAGAGYRTAHYHVLMTGDKTLNFWNNVKDSAEVIEVGKETGKVTHNFLAGDIVKDDEINIYDLSAVVSYFGTDNLVSVHPEYAKYDLNRDGVIDSKDVAYVLVSWGH